VRFDLSVVVRRPPSAVFAVLADPQDYGDHSATSRVPVLTKSPAGPTGVGTRWHEVVRVAPFLRMTIRTVVTAIEANRRIVLDFAASWMHGTLEYTFEPTADGGAVLRQQETLIPRGPLRLADRAIARMLRPNLVQRLEAIRDLLEADAGR
jgi:uncharacterized protein YndB with AHSA1/START domain